MNKVFKTGLVLLFGAFSVMAQSQTFELAKAGTAVVVKGTSSLHDWEMDLKVVNSTFHIIQDGSTINGLDNVSFSCKSTDIKSESSIMDNKAYDALKAKEYPEIKFSSVTTNNLTTDGKKFIGNLKGKLNIAGVTQDVTIPFTGTFTDSKTINVTASTDLTMSSFKIDPPTAILGTLKTGDKISVLFTLQFVQKAQ